MDGIRFDRLTRTLTSAGSRRRALGGLLLGSLGLLGHERVEDAAAHDPSKKCKKKSGKAKKKCLKKAKAHNAQHAAETTAPPPPPAPTCRDGVRNGTETDVDCGGRFCPRCEAAQRCTHPRDCVSAYCVQASDESPERICLPCTENCGSDSSGACYCDGDTEGGAPVCRQSTGGPVVASCDDCPPETVCSYYTGEPRCFPYCGAFITCPPGADACKSGFAACGQDGQCFQPLGGGATRCGAPTVTGSCGCTSHEQCEANHGTGSFCVRVTGSACTGCAAGTFCATPR